MPEKPDKIERMTERAVVQAFGLIELAAAKARRNRDERADLVRVIEGQLNVVRELGRYAQPELPGT